MRYFTSFFALLLISTSLYGQNLDNDSLIHASEKRAVLVSKTVHSEGTTTTQPAFIYIEYDEDGNQVLELDISSENKVDMQEVWTYQEGRLSQRVKYITKLNEAEVVKFEYNEEGLLSKKMEYRNDKPVISYEYFYGDDQQLDSVVWLDKDHKPQLFEYYTYENDLLIEISEKTSYGRKDGRTEFTYRADGSLKGEKLYDSFGDLFEELTYNEQGWLITKKIFDEDAQVTYTFEYKHNGLLKSSTKSSANLPAWEEYKYKWSKEYLAEYQEVKKQKE